MRTAALIYYYGRKYKEIGACAVNSFKKYHPDVDLYYINDQNEKDYRASKMKDEMHLGAYKLLLAAEIMRSKKYDKIICLGADTITCARLDEFMNDHDSDILVTLDYPYPLMEKNIILTPNKETHVNADVVCFNNIKPIIDIIKETKNFPEYGEQAALNYVVWSNKPKLADEWMSSFARQESIHYVPFSDKYSYSVGIVDGPYNSSDVIYNVRSKGNINLPKEYQDHSAESGQPPKYAPYEKPWGRALNKFYVNEGKLYNEDHKQIKVWHYCEGFGNLSEENFIKIMNNYIYAWFNKETKGFFKERCDCGDFFEKEFSF